MVLRNAQGRLSLATPGFDEACEVATTFISLATGKVTSAALDVSGPATASTWSSPASLRRSFVACAGLVASSRITMRSSAPLTPPASLTCFSSICSVAVLVRPHSANGPLDGTIAPRTISGPAACALAIIPDSASVSPAAPITLTILDVMRNPPVGRGYCDCLQGGPPKQLPLRPYLREASTRKRA